MLIDNDGGTAIAASTADIIETPVGSGNYCAARTAPLTVEHYTLVWSTDGSFDENSLATDDLFVRASVAAVFPPLLPGEQVAGPTPGPCFGWVEAEDVAACCSVSVGSDTSLFEMSASSSSQVLFMLSGKQFPGQCERVVRPCSDIPCGVQVLARGHLVGWDGTRWGDDSCGCIPLSRVLLPNRPVTEILEVKIDGAPIAASEYRLDGWRWLTRMADVDGNAQAWPACQRLDLDDTEEGTFSVQYTFGQNPPQPGIDAAAQLACEIYKSCPGNEGVAECKLPKNATRVTRQGITIELNALNYDRQKRVWVTGMNLVDLFLNAYNPNGLKRRPAIWSPDHPRFAQEVGTAMGS
jgi:hypothetical protein